MNPSMRETSSLAVFTVTVRGPSRASGVIASAADPAVRLVTVTGPDSPGGAPPTEIPSPNRAVETPCINWVFVPVIATVSFWPGWPVDGASEIVFADATTSKPSLRTKRSFPVLTVTRRGPSFAKDRLAGYRRNRVHLFGRE